MSPKNFDYLKAEIKTEVNNLGFSHIGYCSPKTPVGFDTYLKWLEKGHSADLIYMQRTDSIDKRRDPRKILESVETIIVLAIPYLPSITSHNELSVPAVASYALGEDYHNIIPVLLREFIHWLESKIDFVKIQYKLYTDTGPILERSYASMAGLGWIGKNACLIIPGEGSYFFLAEILINLYFSPDQQVEKDYCGNCRRCIDSCPTDCIQPNRTIDSAKCISYLTIENKKEIPDFLRDKTKNWVFGCDICQQVCPWNLTFSKIPEHEYFLPNNQLSDLKYELLSNLSEPIFNQFFNNSPLKRTKFKGFKRNMVNAIGNSKNSIFLGLLMDLLEKETDLILIEQIQWAINKISKNPI